MRKDLARIITKHIERLFQREDVTYDLSEGSTIQYFLCSLMDEWETHSNRAPSRGKLNYPQRVLKWVESLKEDSGYVLVKGYGTNTIDLIRVHSCSTAITNGTITINGTSYSHYSVIPIFDSYMSRGDAKVLQSLEEFLTLEKKDTVFHNGIFYRKYNPVYKDNPAFADTGTTNTVFNDTSSFVGTTIVDKSTKNNTTGNETMKTSNKLDTALNVGKQSTNLALQITAGNATNAVVKAAMRPVLEPLLRKMMEPKGVVQRALGKGRVEDSVTAILDSALMDALAAIVLVSLTSSGLITNEKLVKGASLSADAAMLKIASMVDFDAIARTVVDKVSTIVGTLEVQE